MLKKLIIVLLFVLALSHAKDCKKKNGCITLKVSPKVVTKAVRHTVNKVIDNLPIVTREEKKIVKQSVKAAVKQIYAQKLDPKKEIPKVVRRTLKKIVMAENTPVFAGPAKCNQGEVLKFEKQGNTITRSCAAAPVAAVTTQEQVCYGWGDPHFKTTDGKRFDNYQQGDHIFAKSKDGIYQVQTRNGLSRAWGKNAVNQKIAVLVNGVDIFAVNVKEKEVMLNFQKLNLVLGTTKMLTTGGAIKRVEAQKYELISPNGIRTLVDFVWQNDKDYYANVYTYASADVAKDISGFCHENKEVLVAGDQSYFSEKFVEQTAVKARQWTPELKVKAKAFCAKAKENDRKQCYTDYRVGGEKLASASLVVKQDLKTLEHTSAKLVAAVMRGKKTLPAPKIIVADKCAAGSTKWFTKTSSGLTATCTPKVARQLQCQSVGDPHLKTTGNVNFDYQKQGDFLFAKSKDGIFEVQVRQGPMPIWRGATLNKRVAVRVNGYDIVSLSSKTGKLKINHKVVELAVGASHPFALGGAVKRISKNKYETVSPNDYRTLMDYNVVDAKNYYTNLYVYASGNAELSGMCTAKPADTNNGQADGTNSPVAIKSGNMFSAVFVAGKVGTVPKWTRSKKAAATKFCSTLQSGARKSCMFDFRIGGKKLAQAEKNIKKNVKSITKKSAWIRAAVRAINNGKVVRR